MAEATDIAQVRIGPAVVTYVLTMIGAIMVWAFLHPQGPWLVATIAVPLIALFWLALQALKRRRAVGAPSPAERAYSWRVLPFMGAYVALLFAASWAAGAWHPQGPFAWFLALLPALPLVGVIWAMGRLLVEETDEYLRMLYVRQNLVAAGFTLTVTSVWGFLEQFDQVPHVPAYYTFIIWCAGLGLGACVNEARS